MWTSDIVMSFQLEKERENEKKRERINIKNTSIWSWVRKNWSVIAAHTRNRLLNTKTVSQVLSFKQIQKLLFYWLPRDLDHIAQFLCRKFHRFVRILGISHYTDHLLFESPFFYFLFYSICKLLVHIYVKFTISSKKEAYDKNFQEKCLPLIVNVANFMWVMFSWLALYFRFYDRKMAINSPSQVNAEMANECRQNKNRCGKRKSGNKRQNMCNLKISFLKCTFRFVRTVKKYSSFSICVAHSFFVASAHLVAN